MNTPLAVFRVVTPCSDVVGQQHASMHGSLKRRYTATLQHGVTTLKTGGSTVPRSFRILSHHYAVSEPWRWKQYGPPKFSYPITSLRGVRTLKMEAVRSSETLLTYHITALCQNPEDGVSTVLRNFRILQHYAVLHPEDGGSMVPRSFRILSHHYAVSEPWRWKQYGPPKLSYPITSLRGVRTLKMEAVWSSETLLTYHITAQCQNPEDGGSTVLRNVGILPHHYTVSQSWRWRHQSTLKRSYPTASLHGITTQTATWIGRQHKSCGFLLVRSRVQTSALRPAILRGFAVSWTQDSKLNRSMTISFHDLSIPLYTSQLSSRCHRSYITRLDVTFGLACKVFIWSTKLVSKQGSASAAILSSNWSFLCFVYTQGHCPYNTTSKSWHGGAIYMLESDSDFLSYVWQNVKRCIMTAARAGWPGFDPQEGKELSSIRHCVQTGSGPTQPPLQWVLVDLFRSVKMTTQLAPRLRMRPYVFMVWCLIKHRGVTFIFTCAYTPHQEDV
jgi:hypothetical protein